MSEQCTATSKRSGNRCRRHVVGGGPCPMHGGKAPQVAAAREARIATWEAQRGLAPVEDRDPAEALLAAARTADQLVQRLEREMLEDGKFQTATVKALGDWLDRSGRLSKTVLDAMVDERRIRITEVQGKQLFEILRGVLSELGHDMTRGSHAAQVVARHLRAVDAQQHALTTGTNA